MGSIYVPACNLFGPGDNFDLESSHVIPALIRKCWEAKQGGTPEITAWGTGNATREFLYVEDAAEAIVLASENYSDPDLVNLGPGEEITIRGLLEGIRLLREYNRRVVVATTKPEA